MKKKNNLFTRGDGNLLKNHLSNLFNNHSGKNNTLKKKLLSPPVITDINIFFSPHVNLKNYSTVVFSQAAPGTPTTPEEESSCTQCISKSTRFSSFLIELKKYHQKKESKDFRLPSVEFLQLFVGFTEGDGCFCVAKRGDLTFIISQGLDN